jgi:hypothetical protein
VSIVRAALRLAAVEAMLENNRTYAQRRVYDSNNQPLLDLLQPETAGDMPFVIVYTDSDSIVRNTAEHGLYSGTRECQLVFEIGVATAITDKEGIKRLVIPYTDRGMELGLDFLQKQVLDSVFQDARSEWAELVRQMRIKAWGLVSRRSGKQDKNGHWAARQVVVSLDLISDPEPGQLLAPLHVLNQFFELMQERGSVDGRSGSRLIQNALDKTSYASWEILQSQLGLTRRGIRATGIAPLTETADGSVWWATELGAAVTAPSGEAPVTGDVTLQGDPPQPDKPDGQVVSPYVDGEPNAP